MIRKALVNLLQSQLHPLNLIVPDNLEDDAAQLELAERISNLEYHHPDCEAAATTEEQRSFCFRHHRKTDKAILLIHGFTACPYEMRELGYHLYTLGHNVYGVRLAGHGSDVKDFAGCTGSDWEDSVRRGLAITALLGEKVVVIGESMGGALTALLAVEFPLLVSQVILCAPCFRTANRMAWVATFAFVRRLMPTTKMGVTLDWQRPYWYSEIPTSAVAELVRIMRKARKVAAEINVPILVIQAEDDQVVQPRGAEKFFKGLCRLAESDKQLKLLMHGHHNMTIDLNPEKKQVFQWIDEFVKR